MEPSLSALLATRIVKRYAKDNGLPLNQDTWNKAYSLLDSGNLPLKFTTPEGDFMFRPSAARGYSIYFISWESASDPANDPRFWERKNAQTQTNWRRMTTLDDQGNLVFVLAADKPLDQVSQDELGDMTFLGLARVIDNEDQSKEYYMNKQSYVNRTWNLDDYATLESAPSIKISSSIFPGSLGISVVISIYWGQNRDFAQNSPHIWGVPRQILENLFP